MLLVPRAAAGARKLKYVSAVSVGGVLRTNDPFAVQSVQHTNATDGDVYGVATELFTSGEKFAFLQCRCSRYPRHIKYVAAAHFPTDVIYAVRVSRYPNSKWTFDVGTGHVGATLAQGTNIRVNNAVAFAADFRFQERPARYNIHRNNGTERRYIAQILRGHIMRKIEADCFATLAKLAKGSLQETAPELNISRYSPLQLARV